MALSLDRELLDQFCPQLFRALDSLGLLPRQLGAKPNEYEKYPRLLFGSIQRYNDVAAGFREWESRVLRDTTAWKAEQYPQLEELRQWMIQHPEVFKSKANLQHLRTSLYARVFQYLYPRRVLVNAYCMSHKGNPGAVEPAFIEDQFPDSIPTNLVKLRETYADEWDVIISDVRASLLAHPAYYRQMLLNKEKGAAEKPQNSTEEATE